MKNFNKFLDACLLMISQMMVIMAIVYFTQQEPDLRSGYVSLFIGFCFGSLLIYRIDQRA
jgi:uncharacterized membrane-anchored protein